MGVLLDFNKWNIYLDSHQNFVTATVLTIGLIIFLITFISLETDNSADDMNFFIKCGISIFISMVLTAVMMVLLVFMPVFIILLFLLISAFIISIIIKHVGDRKAKTRDSQIEADIDYITNKVYAELSKRSPQLDVNVIRAQVSKTLKKN
jgi:type III secretory pathway component EscV